MKLLIVFFILLIYYYLKFQMHLSIDWKSLYRKGFKKIDNAFGLFCYCGKQGHGKTYSAVKFCIEQKLKNNSTIITNVKSFNVFSDTIYIDDITELISYVLDYLDNWGDEENPPPIIIFFDEIFTILEKQTRINKEILSFISQLRKRKIIFVTTAQEWLEINVTFRRYVRFQIDCNMISLPFLHTAFLINAINDGEQLKWDSEANEYVAPRIATNFSKGNLSIIESYDTFETISTNNTTKPKKAS